MSDCGFSSGTAGTAGTAGTNSLHYCYKQWTQGLGTCGPGGQEPEAPIAQSFASDCPAFQ